MLTIETTKLINNLSTIGTTYLTNGFPIRIPYTNPGWVDCSSISLRGNHPRVQCNDNEQTKARQTVRRHLPDRLLENAGRRAWFWVVVDGAKWAAQLTWRRATPGSGISRTAAAAAAWWWDFGARLRAREKKNINTRPTISTIQGLV